MNFFDVYKNKRDVLLLNYSLKPKKQQEDKHKEQNSKNKVQKDNLGDLEMDQKHKGTDDSDSKPNSPTDNNKNISENNRVEKESVLKQVKLKEIIEERIESRVQESHNIKKKIIKNITSNEDNLIYTTSIEDILNIPVKYYKNPNYNIEIDNLEIDEISTDLSLLSNSCDNNNRDLDNKYLDVNTNEELLELIKSEENFNISLEDESNSKKKINVDKKKKINRTNPDIQMHSPIIDIRTEDFRNNLNIAYLTNMGKKKNQYEQIKKELKKDKINFEYTIY